MSMIHLVLKSNFLKIDTYPFNRWSLCLRRHQRSAWPCRCWLIYKTYLFELCWNRSSIFRDRVGSLRQVIIH